MASDDLNRATVAALMRRQGIDGFAELARMMTAASKANGRTFERSYVSRVMRGERPAHPSFIVACARALREPTIAITGQGIEITDADLEAAS